MKKAGMVRSALVVAVILAISVNLVINRSQAQADRDSLKAQLSAREDTENTAPIDPMQGLVKELGLTDDQRKAFLTAQDEMRKSMAGKRPSGPPKPEQWKQIMASMEAQRKKLDAILTPEQRRKMQTMMGGAGGPFGNMPMPPGGLPGNMPGGIPGVPAKGGAQ